MNRAAGLIIALAIAGGASAQDPDVPRLFFSDHEFTAATTNINPAGASFFGYVVPLDASVASVGGYELGITITDTHVFVLAAAGVVLARLTMLDTDVQTVEIRFGPAAPPSLPGIPVITDGDHPGVVLPCSLFLAPDDVVATLDGVGSPVARTIWTAVKALFD